MSDDKPTPFNLNMHTARLLMREPFFAGLSRRIDKTPCRDIPTAGVRINPERAQFEMLYNPDFMASLSDNHRLAILKHEFYNIIYDMFVFVLHLLFCLYVLVLYRLFCISDIL